MINDFAPNYRESEKFDSRNKQNSVFNSKIISYFSPKSLWSMALIPFFLGSLAILGCNSNIISKKKDNLESLISNPNPQVQQVESTNPFNLTSLFTNINTNKNIQTSNEDANPYDVVNNIDETQLETIENFIEPNTNYYKKFDKFDVQTDWNYAHAQKIYEKYGDFIDNTCNLYSVPSFYFLGKLGAEGAESKGDGSISKTGAIGYSQLFDGAIIQSFKYVLKNKIKDGLLYKKALEYSRADDTQKPQILKQVKYNSKENLEAGIAYAAYLHDYYPDWSLVSAAYQIGPNKFAKIVDYHRKVSKNPQFENPLFELLSDSSGKKYTHITPEMRDYVLENRLDFVDLFDNSNVKNYYRSIKGKYDVVQRYVPQTMIIAGKFQEDSQISTIN